MNLTFILIGLTCLISYRAFNDLSLLQKLKHYPVAEVRNGEYHRLISSGFVHGGWLHLIVNMYVLYGFGMVAEEIFVFKFGDLVGRVIFLFFYLSAIVVADLSTLQKHKDNPGFSSVGASGAVSAVLMTYVIFYPLAPLTFVFFPFVSFPAIALAIAYLIYSSYASKKAELITMHICLEHFMV